MRLHADGTANRRISKDSFAPGLRSLFGGVGSLSLFKIDRIHSFHTCPPQEDSTFIIRYSIFSFLEFHFRLNWPLFRPAAGLNPEPLNL